MSSNPAPVPVCETCEGTGWQPVVDAQGVSRRARCVCVGAARVRFCESVPQEFQAARLTNFRLEPGNTSAHRAAGRFLETTGDLLLIGPVGCIAGETIITSPDGAAAASELSRRNRPIRVWAWDGDGIVAAAATAPYVRGISDLYRITLRDGRSFVATARHRVLTDDGWRVVAELRPRTRLGCSRVPPASNSAHDHLASREGAQRSQQTAADSTGRYSIDRHPGGVPPPLRRGSDQEQLPLRVDALGHSQGHFGGDASAHSAAGTRPCRESGHPSTRGFAHPSDRRSSESAPLFAGPRSSQPFANSRTTARERIEILRQSVAFESPRQVVEAGVQAYGELYFEDVTSVSFERTDFFFDLHVPTYENYLAAGVWHHNCGKTRLACSVLNEHHLAGGRGLFLRVQKLLFDMQHFYGIKTEEERAEERAFLERLFATPLLVLDDLGVEKGSDYSARMLYTVYEERSDRGLRTIWTSNLGLAPDPKDRGQIARAPTLGEFMGDDRLPSRLAGRAVVAYLKTRDQRLPFGRTRDGV